MSTPTPDAVEPIRDPAPLDPPDADTAGVPAPLVDEPNAPTPKPAPAVDLGSEGSGTSVAAAPLAPVEKPLTDPEKLELILKHVINHGQALKFVGDSLARVEQLAAEARSLGEAAVAHARELGSSPMIKQVLKMFGG
jgi:hypothetical protein